MKFSKDFFSSITPPAFDHACPTCATPSTRAGLCLTCERAQRSARDAKMATVASMPTRFVWASGLNAPELSVRVDGAALEQARAADVKLLDRVTLLGTAGAGKTSLGVAIANEWASVTARPALFFAAADIAVARQQHGLGEGEAPIVRQAMNAALLVLDDLGQEWDMGAPVVAHVVQHRYDQAQPTITTSGRSVEQLVSRYGAGVVRRLIETSGGALVLRLRTCERGSP
jgi:DNA replication protein DnaC